VAGTVTVAEGGTIKSPALGADGLPAGDNTITYTGNGKIELEQGATGYYGDSLFVSDSTTEGFYTWDTGATGSKVTLKGGNVTELTAGSVTARATTGIAAQTSIVVADSATLTVADSVVYTVAGTLTVKDGGTLKVPALDGSGLPSTGHIAYAGSGAVELEQGATGYYGDSLFVSDSTTAGFYTWDTGATGSKVTLKSGNVTELTAGSVTAREATGIAASTSIVVADGATLTVANVVFQVGGTLTVQGSVLGTGGASIQNGGTITVESTGTKNFYPNNDTTALETINADTYTWNATAGGAGTAGWKAAGAGS
jgi:hypothetical protein